MSAPATDTPSWWWTTTSWSPGSTPDYLATVTGFSVVATVHTGAEALAALTEFHPDLMLLDVYLPDMTGIEVLRRARQEFPGRRRHRGDRRP